MVSPGLPDIASIGTAQQASRLVVRTKRSRLVRAVLLGLGGAMVLVAVVAAFLFGRQVGLGEWRDGVEDLRALAALVAAREAESERLQRQLAVAKTASGVERSAMQETREALVNLERELQRQREEIDFYRTIVAPEDGVAGLRIQDVRLRPGVDVRRYELQIVLVQAAKHDRVVKGVVDFAVEGRHDGAPRSLRSSDLELADDDHDAALSYRFKYFTDLEQSIRLPEGFEPDRVVVEVSPDGDSDRVLRRSFEWSAIS
ncbi:MAG: DUF6776 family protein [Pseudomonadota bacterium]